MTDWKDLEKLARGEDKDSILRLLNAMDDIDFGMEVKSLSKKLNIGTTDLRAMRKSIKQQSEPDISDAIVEDLEPWSTTVYGSNLADQIEASLQTHAVLTEHLPETISLWVVSSYLYDSFGIFPRLNITAPEKGCGKSTLLDIVAAYSHKALEVENISPAAIYRTIDVYRPTLLIDEADTFLRENEDARGILNSSHKKGGGVVRLVGDQHEPKKFSTYTPIVICGIGRIPDTLRSRSIVINISRMAGSETITTMDSHFDKAAKAVRRQLITWRLQVEGGLLDPGMLAPHVSNRRVMDNWNPLFVVAGMIGGNWPEKCLAAFHSANIHGADDEAISTKLLADIKDIFRWKGERIHSADLVESLVILEDQPWATWRRGKPMTPDALARLLSPYGIRPDQMRIGTISKKGYSLNQFKEVFFRYLQNAETPETPKQNTADCFGVSGVSGIQGTENKIISEDDDCAF